MSDPAVTASSTLPEPPAPSQPSPPASLVRDLPALGLLALALAGNLALAGYLKWREPHLPELLPMHFNAYGEVDLIGERWEVYRFPLIGLVVLCTNAALAVSPLGRRWPRPRFLMAIAMLVQGLFWIAALNITGWLG
jgi:hypothetical protein